MDSPTDFLLESIRNTPTQPAQATLSRRPTPPTFFPSSLLFVPNSVRVPTLLFTSTLCFPRITPIFSLLVPIPHLYRHLFDSRTFGLTKNGMDRFFGDHFSSSDGSALVGLGRKPVDGRLELRGADDLCEHNVRLFASLPMAMSTLSKQSLPSNLHFLDDLFVCDGSARY